jgi:hypothetical protein
MKVPLEAGLDLHFLPRDFAAFFGRSTERRLRFDGISVIAMWEEISLPVLHDSFTLASATSCTWLLSGDT